MFDSMDEMRRGVGRTLDLVGLGPQELPYRIAFETRGARLRAYQDATPAAVGPPVLVIPAPFKRPYVWDLLPEVSAVRQFLARGFRVYLLEWTPPGIREDDLGLTDYACNIPDAALRAIHGETQIAHPILAGNSIGGTLAAIFAALYPARVGGLALIDAPLAFGPHGGPLGAAVAMIPHARFIRSLFGSPVPGSAIDVLCALAAPEVFHFQRQADLLACAFGGKSLSVHLHMERWSYHEFALPGRLFDDIVERLYRNDEFFLGKLTVGDRVASLSNLRGRILAVVNPEGIVVPPASLTEGLKAARNASVEILQYDWDVGPMLQHLGPLVSPAAHARLWPAILAWAERRTS